MEYYNKYIKYKNKYLALRHISERSEPSEARQPGAVRSYISKIIKKYYKDKKPSIINIKTIELNKIKENPPDILYISILDNKGINITDIVNKYGKYTKMILVQIPRGYDFESFVRAINYDHVDVHKKHKDNVYYGVIKTI